MRTFFLLLLLAGLALGFGYPVAVERFGKAEIGRYRGYDRAGGYRPVEVPLKAGNAPVGVDVEMTATGPAVPHAGAVLTLVVDRAGRSVLAAPLDFAAGSPRETNPQNGERIYSQSAGSLTDIDEGVYRFRLGPGDAEGVAVGSADICCGAAACAYDARMPPIGWALSALGFVGLVLAVRRRRPAVSADRPPRRWGRGAAP